MKGEEILSVSLGYIVHMYRYCTDIHEGSPVSNTSNKVMKLRLLIHACCWALPQIDEKLSQDPIPNMCARGEKLLLSF